MGGRGINLVAAALLSAATSLAPARALDCPILELAELDRQAAQLSPEARERFFEQIALERIDDAGFIGVVAPIAVRQIASSEQSTRAFIVRYEVQRRIRGPDTPTIEILHTHWCDADCDQRSEHDLLRTAAALSPRPGEVARIPEIAGAGASGQLLAASRIVAQPEIDRSGRTASLSNVPPGVAFRIGDCSLHRMSAQGHAAIDRWILNRLRWMLGVNDQAWAHWGPAPTTPPVE